MVRAVVTALCAVIAAASIALPAGGTATVRLVKDIRPGTGGSNVTMVRAVGEVMFFVADDGVHGNELWRSNGRRAGTRLVKDVWPGRRGSIDVGLWFGGCGLAVADGILYFAAATPDGSGLWRSDGTASGTVLVAPVQPECLTASGTRVYFAARDDAHGVEPWVSDGTPEGTRRLKDVRSKADSSYPQEFTAVDGRVFFTARDDRGRELWTSDGTRAGTVMVRDINRRGGSRPGWLTRVGDRVFFFANDGIHGQEPWRSDGTKRGTALVTDIDPGAGSSYPSYFTDVAGQVFFWAGRGRRVGDSIVWRSFLWRSDGTETGTVKVKAVDVGPWDPDQYWYYPGTVAAVDDTLFFTSEDASSGLELWTSDGTRRGTHLVKDIAPGRKDSVPYWLTDLEGTLYFFAFDHGPRGRAPLWRSDGTKTGTVIVEDVFRAPSRVEGPPPAWITEMGGAMYLAGARLATGYELWALSEP